MKDVEWYLEGVWGSRDIFKVREIIACLYMSGMIQGREKGEDLVKIQWYSQVDNRAADLIPQGLL